MTTLTCDLCKNEVVKFMHEGSANFPEDYREVCDHCYALVLEAKKKADEVADKARDKAFTTAFKRAIKEPN